MNPITTPNVSRLISVSALSLMMSANWACAQSSDPVPGDSLTQSEAVESRVRVLMPQRRVGTQHITNISAVDVDVRLTDTLATTHIQIKVENHGSSTTQARLVLPVPDGSTIRSFGIDGIGDEPTARLLPRDEASRRYQEIVRSLVDPGLLEFVGNAMIQSSVFPVEPGKARTMTIVYEQSLDAHRGRVEYVLPRSASYAGSAINWSIDIELESSGALGPVFSPSHPIVSKITGAQTMKVAVPMLDEPGPFRLYAMLAGENDATTMLYSDPDDPNSGYFMFVADAPEIDRDADSIPREITIVIDRSGSMNGEKIQQARESAKQIVSGMNLGEFVHIIDYADDVRSFSDQPVQITKESLPALIKYIDNIQSRGGTNLHDALIEALGSKVTNGHLPMVLFLTDGLATVGTTDESAIRNAAKEGNTHERRVFTFGVGYDVNVPLLDGLAMDTRAESTFVLPNEDVEMKVGQVFDKLDGPVIIEPIFSAAYTVDGLMPMVDLRLIEPDTLSDVFSGSRVIVLGQYKNLLHEPARMWVRPSEGAQQESDALAAEFFVKDASVRYAFIARLWAQKRIDSLINDIRLAGADGSEPDKELVDEIVRLSLEHGIMSEYTAFLADEEFGLELANAPTELGRTYAADEAQESISAKSRQRSGKGGYSQTANRSNLEAQQMQQDMDSGGGRSPFTGTIQAGAALKANKYYDFNMQQIVINSIQRGQGSTLYKKKGKWVDAKLGEQADEAPEIIINFGDEAYSALVEDLVAQGRQWILANRGDVYIMNHSKRVLVHNPE